MSTYKDGRRALRDKMRFREQTLLGLSAELTAAEEDLRESREWERVEKIGALLSEARAAYIEARLEFLQSQRPPKVVPSCGETLLFSPGCAVAGTHFCGKEARHGGDHRCGHHLGTIVGCGQEWAQDEQE